ncbi:MAG: alpha/beta hydrolase [Methylobacterium mesophilicum]|nr:alpha/beta hydrolase [Methylobacterium mesophilicum]
MPGLKHVCTAGLVAVLLMFLAGCSALGTFNSVVPKDGGGAKIARDVGYGPDARQKLDVYAPQVKGGRRKILVFLYGGSWSSGRRQDYAFVGRAFAARGFVTVIPDYRLVPEVRYPLFVQDNAKAVAWAYRHARDYGADPEQLYVVGHSAGAYNAMMVALAPEFLRAEGLEPSVIRAVAGLSGPYDFLPLDQTETREAFKGVRDLAATQPVNRVRPGRKTPAILLLHGEADDFVEPRNSQALASALRNAGDEVDLRLYPRVDHRETLLALSTPLRWKAPVLDDVSRFFAEH